MGVDHVTGRGGVFDGRVLGTGDDEVVEDEDEAVEEQCACDAVPWLGWQSEGGSDPEWEFEGDQGEVGR